MSKKILEAAPSNITSRAKIDSRVEELGVAAANGADSLPTLGQEVAQWAAENAINPNAPSKADIDAGKPVTDHITEIFERYATSANAKAMHQRSQKSNSNKAQISKLRAFGKLGARTDLVLGGPDFLSKVCETRNTLARQGQKVKPAYDAMLSAIREVSDKSDLNDAEIETAIRAKTSEAPDALKIYQSMDRLLKDLFERKLDNSDTAKSIRSLVTQRIGELDQASKFTAWQKAGETFGFTHGAVLGRQGVFADNTEEMAEE